MNIASVEAILINLGKPT